MGRYEDDVCIKGSDASKQWLFLYRSFVNVRHAGANNTIRKRKRTPCLVSSRIRIRHLNANIRNLPTHIVESCNVGETSEEEARKQLRLFIVLATEGTNTTRSPYEHFEDL